jgi:alkaline phosphatase
MRNMRRRISFGVVFLVLLMAGGAQASPKNIIIMIGDGMGPEQVEAGRLVAGGDLVMEQMDPNPGSVITLNVYGDITDSAASATAYATGYKTANGNVSMAEDDETVLPTSMEAAKAKGMATGILSSVYLCDATPGVWLAHAPRRSCSTIIPQQVDACPDVFLGPGEKVSYQRGGRGKNRVDYITDLVENCHYEQVGNADELAAAQAPNDRLLGIWGGYTLMYDIDQQNDPGYNLPSLAEMTDKAIEVLSRDPDGFMLVVEGGGIDWMAHNKDVAGTARDVVAYDDAVAVAYNFAMADGDTLLIVTADHETGGLVLGDSPEVEFIRSITASTDFMWGLVLRGEMSAEDALATYAGVTDLSQAEKDAIEAYGETAISDALSARANVQWILPNGDVSVAPEEGDHTVLDVPVYAFGPGSESLEGQIQNTVIGDALFDAVNGD